MLNIQSVAKINNINPINASFEAAKNMDGKIFVSTDMLTPEKVPTNNVSELVNRLNNIDKMSKDRNGSSFSLLYTKSESSDKQQKQQTPEAYKTEGKLLNVYI